MSEIKNPYPEFITDESSGIEVKNRDHEVYAEACQDIRRGLENHKFFCHKVGVSDGDMWRGDRVGYESWLKIPLCRYDRDQKKQVDEPAWQKFWEGGK